MVTDTDHSLELSHRFNAPPEQVFDAWLTKEWGRWLAPGEISCEISEIDPRPGGSYVARMTRPDGKSFEIIGNYRVVERPTRLILTWVGSFNNQETVIDLRFEPQYGGTLMTLRQTGFTDRDTLEGFGRGWTGPLGSFKKLERLLLIA